MRNVLTAIVAVLIPIAEFVALLRFGILKNFGPFLIFFTMFVLLIWASRQHVNARRLILQKAAASFGFQPADLDDVTLTIYPLRGDGWINCAAYGELRGLKGWIFDYTLSDHGSAETNRTISQTVIAFDVEDTNLPIFQIRPLDWSTSIFDNKSDWKFYEGDWEKSDQTICFPDATGFHRCFELMSTAEEAVRRHFNAKLLNTIAALNECDYMVKGYYTSVLVFTPSRMLQPQEIEAFARKGADLAYAIFSAEKRVMATSAK